MKKYYRKAAAALLAAGALLVTVPGAYAGNSPFTDVAPDHWAYDAIVEANDDGVMMGTAAEVFSPAGKLNLSQFVTVLTRAFYPQDVENMSFAGPWPEPNYNAAYLHDLFTDVKSYTRDMEVTREVMAQMMYNVMVDKGAILPNDAEIQATMNKIPDLASVDSDYRTAVAVCYYLDLLSGVDARGTYAPKGVLNRAQTAVIYTRLKNAISILGTGMPGTTNPETTNPGATNPGTTTPGTTNPGTATPETPQNPSGATLTNGMPVTEENVLALIEEYRNGKAPGEKAQAAGFTSYVDGAKYDAYDPKYRIVLPSGPINGIECGKFAYAFFDDLFGSDVPMREVTDPADVRPGDLLHFSGHWSIATSGTYDYKSRGPHVHDVGGGSAGSIGWTDGNISIANSLIAAYTRYPN